MNSEDKLINNAWTVTGSSILSQNSVEPKRERKREGRKEEGNEYRKKRKIDKINKEKIKRR